MDKPVTSIRLTSVMLDCANPIALAQFYAALLGGEAKPVFGGCAIVAVPGLNFSICFQHEPGYQPPAWPAGPGDQQIMAHLDFEVEDLQKAVDCALSLGAVKPDYQFCQPDWEPQWVTLLDPAGHPFCLGLPWDEDSFTV